jgi:PEP-CTERM motif-containing protein
MKRIFAFLVLCFGIAAAASAEPVRLTSGTMQADDDYIASFSLFGNAFAAEGSGLGAPIVPEFVVGPVDFSGDFGMFSVNSSDNAEVTAGGQTFRGYASASFRVRADPLVIPETDRGRVLFNTPFSARGQIQIFDAFRGGGSLLFSQDVTGSGTLSFAADNVDNGKFFTRSMALTFSPAESPAPTPEPGSWLLLGTGLVAGWQSRRFRRARN